MALLGTVRITESKFPVKIVWCEHFVRTVWSTDRLNPLTGGDAENLNPPALPDSRVTAVSGFRVRRGYIWRVDCGRTIIIPAGTTYVPTGESQILKP